MGRPRNGARQNSRFPYDSFAVLSRSGQALTGLGARFGMTRLDYLKLFTAAASSSFTSKTV